MPMDCGQLEVTSHQNVRVVPVEPDVKSAKTFKLFNAGVSAKAKTGKSADPACYNPVVGWKTNATGCLTMWR